MKEAKGLDLAEKMANIRAPKDLVSGFWESSFRCNTKTLLSSAPLVTKNHVELAPEDLC